MIKKYLKYFIFQLFLLFISLSFIFSNNYYFSSSYGNDAYTSQEAQNYNTPWKSIDQLNNSMNLFNPGDSILFNRGDIFIGQIKFTCSGSSEAKIVLSAYGMGDSPVIQANMTISSWHLYSGKIWVAKCSQFDTNVTNFLINGKSQQIGRFPNQNESNKGYLNIKSHINNSQLTSNSLTSAHNWTGAEAVIRIERWILERIPIQSHYEDALIFSKSTAYEIKNDYGFFIQNHINTLDQQGEWYYDSNNKNMYVYSTINPNSLITEASACLSTFSASNINFVSLEFIEFRGSIDKNINILNSSEIEFKNNIISESGTDAFCLGGCNHIDFKSNRIFNTNNNAIEFNNCNNIVAKYNVIQNVGLRAGMGNEYIGINAQYKIINCVLENNIIDSIGYIGIYFGGDTINIKNNFITNFCVTLDDGGGIYTWGDGISQHYNQVLENNIVLNGIGAPEGTDNPVFTAAEGIYLDDRSSNVFVINNTVAKCNRGIFVHNARNISIVGNTLYNNSSQLLFKHDSIAPLHNIIQCVIKDNIFFSKLKSQIVAEFSTIDDGIKYFGNFDNNYYCRPIDDEATLFVSYRGNTGIISNYMNLANWKTKFNYDITSRKSPFSIPEYRIIRLNSNNKIANGTFDTDIFGWNSGSNYDNGYTTWNSDEIDGGCLRLDSFTPSGKSDAITLTYCSIDEVLVDNNYILKYSMIGSTPGKFMKLYILRNNFPYSLICPFQNILIDTSRKEIEILFTVDSTETDSRLDFQIQEDSGPVWIDNVELYNADIYKTNIDEYVKFLYNTNNYPLPFEIKGNIFDVKGKKNDSFLLQPFSSIILMSTTPFSGGTFEPITNQIFAYPIPANKLISILSPGIEFKKIYIIDIYGRIVIEEYSWSEQSSIDVSSLPKGIYVIQIPYQTKIAVAKFIKY